MKNHPPTRLISECTPRITEIHFFSSERNKSSADRSGPIYFFRSGGFHFRFYRRRADSWQSRLWLPLVARNNLRSGYRSSRNLFPR